MSFTARTHRDLKATSYSQVDICGKVAIGATGAVGTALGKGFVVARTSAGLYTITLSGTGAIPAILHADVQAVFATGTNTQDAHVLSLNAATRVVTVQFNDAGTVDTAAELPNGSFISFRIAILTQAGAAV